MSKTEKWLFFGPKICQNPQKSAKIHENLIKMMVFAIYKPQVQVSANLFFFFLKNKFKIRKKIREFFKQCQKLKNIFWTQNRLKIKKKQVFPI